MFACGNTKQLTTIPNVFKPADYSVMGKVTEAANGQIIITKIEGKNIAVAQTNFTKRIEFIGNSITCGFGNDMATAYSKYPNVIY